MKVRRRALAPGWYPDTESGVRSAVLDYLGESPRGHALSCLAPHAGWYFSGKLSAQAIASLDPDAQTVAVLGGHLGSSSPVLSARDDAVETVSGLLPVDRELQDLLDGEFDAQEDLWVDNTVEVELPFVATLFPKASILWFRLPAGELATEFGRRLHFHATTLGRRVVVIGSSDLTHYGDSYGFSPKGDGPAALEWMKAVNDRRFLESLLAQNPKEALHRALSEDSACSPGAAIGALGFALASGRPVHSELLAYATSADRQQGSSFVGYGAVSWTL